MIRLNLPTLPNLTNIKHPFLRNVMLPQRLLQLLRRFQNIFLSKHPRTPMHTQRLSTLGILEYLHRVVRIGMHGTHDPSR